MKPKKYPKCAVCGKELKDGCWIEAYRPHGKQVERGIKCCSVECERKLK